MNSHNLEARQVRRLLTESAQLQALIVMTWRNRSSWRVGKSRMGHADADAACFTVQAPVTTDAGLLALLPVGLNLGLSLRSGHKKHVFASTILSTGPAGMQLAWPEYVQQMQRRCYQRVEWRGEKPLEVLFWAGGLACDPDSASQPTWTGTLLDVSAGGMRIRWPSERAFPLPIGTLLGCRFAPERNRSPLTLEAICRHTEVDGDGRTAAGFQFIGLECTEDGRAQLRHLARVVSRLQREHIHRRATDLSYRLRHV